MDTTVSEEEQLTNFDSEPLNFLFYSSRLFFNFLFSYPEAYFLLDDIINNK
jgi:hypothetical protein